MESSHISALQVKHAGIDRQIHEEMNRPNPNISNLQLLKRRKLKIKDQLLHT